MRVTVRKVKGVKYVYIHESYRDPETGKPRHKTIRSYGRLDVQLEKDPDFLDNLYEEVKNLNEKQNQLENNDLKIRLDSDVTTSMEGLQDACEIYNYGELIYEKMFNQILDPNKIKGLTEDERSMINYANLIDLIRAGDPIIEDFSKHSPASRESHIFDYTAISNEDLIQLLNILGKHKATISQAMKHEIDQIVPHRNASCIADLYSAMSNPFHNQDCILHQKFVLGLVTDEHMIPITFGLYYGKQMTTSSLILAAGEYMKLSRSAPFMISTDRGFRDQYVFPLLRRDGHHPLIAARIAHCSDELLNGGLFESGFIEDRDPTSKKLRHKYKEFSLSYDNNSVFEGFGSPILYYSPKLKIHDQMGRDHRFSEEEDLNFIFLDKCEGSHSRITHRAITLEEISDLNSPIQLGLFDGYRIVFCEKSSRTPCQTAKLYYNYWNAQAFLRLLQEKLSLIDGIDWTQNLIIGACMVFMIGVALQTTIEYKVRKAGFSIDRESLTNLYSNANVTVLRQDGVLHFIKTKTSHEFDTIAKSFGLEPLSTLETAESFKRKLGLIGGDADKGNVM